MELHHMLRFAVACGALSLACGCSAAAVPARSPEASASATTELSSALVASPAPKVGKSCRSADVSADDAADLEEMNAPKEPRRTSDSPRRTGGFGFGSLK